MGIPLFVGLVFFALGIFIFIYGILALLKTRNQSANALAATGVVTAFDTQMGRRGYLYFPQVDFQLATGQIIRFQSAVGTNPPAYSIGQQVKVLYSAQNPQEAEIDSVTSMWLLPGCMVGMGLLFIVLGAILSGMMILVARNHP